MHSKWRRKICICSVILKGNLDLFEITRASVLFSRKFKMQFSILQKWEFFLCFLLSITFFNPQISFFLRKVA